MGISNKDIENIINEIRPCLLRGRIQKIYQPYEYALTLDIRGKGRNYLLHFSIQAPYSRIHLIEQKYENPPKPLPFCLFLRKYLTNSLIESIEQIDRDRLIRFTLLRGTQRYNFIAELFSKGGNLVLVDQDEKVLMAALNKSQKDIRLKVGNKYSRPKNSFKPKLFPQNSDSFNSNTFFLTKR